VCAAGVLLLTSAAQAQQSPRTALILSATHGDHAQRDERASPLRYAGGLWGATLQFQREGADVVWQFEADIARGQLTSSATRDDDPRESSSSVSLHGAWLRRLGADSAWQAGVAAVAQAGLRVHTYGQFDAGYGEVLTGAGPVVAYRHRLGGSLLRVQGAFTAATLLARPYADIRGARSGDVVVSAGVVPTQFAARGSASWTTTPTQSASLVFRYHVDVQHAARAHHFGSVRHTLSFGVAWQRF
jgi:hypothetical protein